MVYTRKSFTNSLDESSNEKSINEDTEETLCNDQASEESMEEVEDRDILAEKTPLRRSMRSQDQSREENESEERPRRSRRVSTTHDDEPDYNYYQSTERTRRRKVDASPKRLRGFREPRQSEEQISRYGRRSRRPQVPLVSYESRDSQSDVHINKKIDGPQALERENGGLPKELQIDMNYARTPDEETSTMDGGRRHSKRERKELFHSLNLRDMEETLQKKIEAERQFQEEQRGMYDLIKRRRKASESHQDDTEENEEEEEDKEE
jgi:hypothetical protein